MRVDRGDLHCLVDELPDDQITLAAEELRRRMRSRPARSAERPSWMAMGPSKHAGTDDARRTEGILAEVIDRR